MSRAEHLTQKQISLVFLYGKNHVRLTHKKTLIILVALWHAVLQHRSVIFITRINDPRHYKNNENVDAECRHGTRPSYLPDVSGVRNKLGHYTNGKKYVNFLTSLTFGNLEVFEQKNRHNG